MVIATISIVEAHCAIRGLQVTEIRNRYVSVLIHLIKGLTDGILQHLKFRRNHAFPRTSAFMDVQL